MRSGTFYAVGLGPGDEELLTLKAVRLLQRAAYVYVPFSRLTTQSWVHGAVQQYANQAAVIREVSFSLQRSREKREQHWQATATSIIQTLQQGNDVVFVTLGDPLLYSTAIYLLRALRRQWADVKVEIVPGVSAYSHCAALTHFAVGEGTKPVTIIPAVTAMEDLQAAIQRGGTLVLMKIGHHLPAIIDMLEENGLIHQAVFVARAGFPEQRIETDLRSLRGADPACGNLAIILLDTEENTL
ncbi:precorrin-2 C20-methyltransferase /cobalt-factor II C20-methyltransferase [Desulfuromusa kysingii]|uniref:Precorrin-2 C20-methyltransferase /cobalt-factor II C20-methyltransferase n=1 Tax=Desulfuromusa kysingii TaxID=37625 RepID=A0A1H4AHN9_9BACT|nr:precorrin-2 C(20)-methyltransferase [Desulfuromusa kysingii]SEA35519.1 precorrin-2 C20-methyltransferase /cobalt-factor II C20-methyltransferase [Desulfuromusa kysingii]